MPQVRSAGVGLGWESGARRRGGLSVPSDVGTRVVKASQGCGGLGLCKIAKTFRDWTEGADTRECEIVTCRESQRAHRQTGFSRELSTAHASWHAWLRLFRSAFPFLPFPRACTELSLLLNSLSPCLCFSCPSSSNEHTSARMPSYACTRHRLYYI